MRDRHCFVSKSDLTTFWPRPEKRIILEAKKIKKIENGIICSEYIRHRHTLHDFVIKKLDFIIKMELIFMETVISDAWDLGF